MQCFGLICFRHLHRTWRDNCELLRLWTNNHQASLSWYTVEMATAQRTRPRAVVGAPRRAAWQPKSVSRHSISVAPRTIIFYIFLQLLQVNYFAMSNNGRSWCNYNMNWRQWQYHVVTIHIFRVLKQSMVPSVEAIIAWSILFWNSEHPKIGYFGYNELSFDWLNTVCFLTPRKRFWFW